MSTKQQSQLDGQYPGLNGISYAIGYLEQFLAIVSEPLLMACAAIAVVDFLTGGKLLTLPALAYTWASTIAIAVSACFIVTWRRSFKAFVCNRYGVSIGLALLGLVLGLVDWAAIDVQSLQQAIGINFSQALAQLNLNIELITHIRSAVAIIMAAVVALSNHTAVTTAQAPKRRLALLDKVLDKIAPVVDEQSKQEVLAESEQQGTETAISSTEQEPEQDSEQPGEQISEQEPVTDRLPVVNARPSNSRKVLAFTSKSNGDAAKRVRKALKVNPGATLTELARKANVSRGYASQIRAQVLKEQQETEQAVNV